ncbi:hypothetical protein ACFE04_017250 [Oxalis oulophora]
MKPEKSSYGIKCFDIKWLRHLVGFTAPWVSTPSASAVLVPNCPDGVPFGRGGRVAPKRGRRQVKKGESKWNRAKWRETKGERRGDSTKERIILVEARLCTS